MRWSLRLATVLLLVSACTHNAQESTGASDQVITEDEIAKSLATNAYDAVAKLRANFLSNRGKITILNGNSSPVPVVYVDGTLYGELATLRNIPAAQVATIRLYRAWEAQQKFGNGKLGGVIEVTTKQ